MKQLLIIQCSNQYLWYRDLVGQVVPNVRDIESEHCWLSREPEGFVNIVRKTDAVPLPLHHLPIKADDLVQHGDFAYVSGHVWIHVALHQIGKPPGTSIVVRRTDQPDLQPSTSSRSQ